MSKGFCTGGNMKSITIGPNEEGQRLDRFLSKYLNNSSRTNLFKLIRKKVFKVNGVKIKEDYFLKNGDILEIYLSDETLNSLVKEAAPIEAEDVDLDIIFEDDELLVVHKPKGLLTHPDQNEYKNTLSSKVQIYLRHLATRTFKPAPIHRLDKNTSGVVLFAKTYEALKKYNALMREREIHKYYICVVEGTVSQAGEVKGFLTKDEASNKVRLTSFDRDDSKLCHTLYKPIKNMGYFTLVEVELLTGRSHQIRASMAFIGHPIVGDVKYGAKKVKNVENQLLHGYKVCIGERTFSCDSEEINAFLTLHSPNGRWSE